MSGKTEHQLAALLDAYGLSLKPEWEANALTDLTNDHRTRMFRHLGSLRTHSLSLSGDGIIWFENEIEENALAMFEAFGLRNPYAEAQPTEPVPPSTFAKVNWSKVTDRLGPSGMREIKNRANALLAAVDQADMDERSRDNARKHVQAVVELLEAPDPPWKEIVQLLNNPVFCAILNVTSMLQLIAGVF